MAFEITIMDYGILWNLTPTDAEIITIGKTAHVCAAEYRNC